MRRTLTVQSLRPEAQFESLEVPIGHLRRAHGLTGRRSTFATRAVSSSRSHLHEPVTSGLRPVTGTYRPGRSVWVRHVQGDCHSVVGHSPGRSRRVPGRHEHPADRGSHAKSPRSSAPWSPRCWISSEPTAVRGLNIPAANINDTAIATRYARPSAV